MLLLVLLCGLIAGDAARVVRTMDAGGLTTCAVLFDGTIKCFGDNRSGQLGIGHTVSAGHLPGTMGENLETAMLGTNRSFSSVSVGETHACALTTDGSVVCWGSNIIGQLGYGDRRERGSDPADLGNALPLLSFDDNVNVKQVCASKYASCALSEAGRIYCWGMPYVIPGRYFDPILIPTEIPIEIRANSISCGAYHVCALLKQPSDNLFCFGSNMEGELGQGYPVSRTVAYDQTRSIFLGVNSTATHVAAGNGFTCAILDSGDVKCFGSNRGGKVGLGIQDEIVGNTTQDMLQLPHVDLGSRSATSITCGDDHVCVVADETVLCWGLNQYGSLGIGSTRPIGLQPQDMGVNLVPTAVDRVALIRAGNAHTCVLREDHSMQCWGYGEYGALGQGSRENIGDEPGEVDVLPLIQLRGQHPFTNTPAPTTAEPTTAAVPTTVEPTTALLPATTFVPTTVEPTTAAVPTTMAPTTDTPTTIAPTTAEPTTLEPVTLEPSTVAPTTVKPTIDMPTTVAPTTAEPTATVAPTTLEPPTIEPTTSTTPTTLEPPTIEPTTSTTPTTLEPTTQTPNVDPTRIPTTDPTTDPTAVPTTVEPPTTSQPGGAAATGKSDPNRLIYIVTGSLGGFLLCILAALTFYYWCCVYRRPATTAIAGLASEKENDVQVFIYNAA